MRTSGYIPMEKRSKKEQRKHHAAQRNGWNEILPVTKVIPNKKRPTRSQLKTGLRKEVPGE